MAGQSTTSNRQNHAAASVQLQAVRFLASPRAEDSALKVTSVSKVDNASLEQ